MAVAALSWAAACSGIVSSGDTPNGSGQDSDRDDNRGVAGIEGQDGDHEPGSTKPAPAADQVDDGMPIPGLLGCPTSPAPPYEGTRYAGTALAGDSGLSGTFRALCAACHGATGAGQGAYPPLPGKLDASGFADRVRRGSLGHGMPAFDRAQVSDLVLTEDFRVLARLRAAPPSPAAPRSTAAWTAAQQEEAYREGMKAWRKADANGTACAGCHAPDAIDLAVFAYSDAEIQRRGYLHLAPDDVARVVDLVHAQRQRFGITRPCRLDWAPFQPGGKVLAGSTPVEVDLALDDELRARDLKIVTGRLSDRQSAIAAFDEFARLDLRQVPLGIELPRWTNDPFRGDAHRSWNDWITPVDFTSDQQALERASDRYLASPTTEAFFEVERVAVGQLGGSHAGLYNDWFRNASKAKRRSILLGSHFFRMALTKQQGWFELPMVPFPALAVTYNPFALIGGATQEFACNAQGGSFGGGTCPRLYQTFAPDQRTKFGGPIEGDINPRLEELTHAWWTLAALFDQPMLGSEDNAIDGSYFYWQFRFPQKAVHLPFLFAHIAAARVRYDEELRQTSEFPRANWHDFKTRAVLSTYNYGPREGGARRGGPLILDVQPDVKDASFEAGVRLRVNLIRAFAWKQLDALAAGHPVEIKTAFVDWYLGMEVNGTRYGGVKGFVRNLASQLDDAAVASRFPALVQDRDHLTKELESLVDEVVMRVQAAREACPGCG
jgi:cytochrome c553